MNDWNELKQRAKDVNFIFFLKTFLKGLRVGLYYEFEMQGSLRNIPKVLKQK